jgi:hypothetical protein
MWGSRRFLTGDDSRNNWWVALMTFGEGWHNNHHAHPTSARHGLAWYEFDPTWIQIRILQSLGIARSVAFITFRFILLFRQGIGTRPGDDSSSIALPPSTMDASDQAGASLPYWTLGLFSPGSGLARMNRQNPYRRGPSTSDIHCGDLHRRRCIGPDFPLDR